ncbi:MAG: tRNA lysidine(34) synthetase TilS [Chryseolinea sp.]
MLDLFLNHIDKFKLCQKSDQILLAVSGGLDSTTMLYLFREAGYKVAVAHCNFQLRGRESDGDEAFVTTVCKELRVTCYTKRFDTEAYAWERTLSTQLAARELRYAWFKELLIKHQYAWLATAHHFDDSMETIVLNLSRGSGIDGMAGIPVKNDQTIRPLLFASRQQVEKYAVMKGLVWREDITNMTDNYQRNFIRHHIIPRLKDLNPSLETTWHSGIEKVKGEIALLHELYEKWKTDFVKSEKGRVTIDKAGFALYKDNPAMVWRCCREFGFNFEQAKDISRALHTQAGKKFITHGFTLVIDRQNLIITDRLQNWGETMIEKSQTTSYLGPWTLDITTMAGPEIPLNENTALLDSRLLTFPLKWRKWKSGDSFCPLGMTRKKKLSNFFIDLKLSMADKERATVIESDGMIIWVAGYRIDDRFKVTGQTTSRISLTLTSA